MKQLFTISLFLGCLLGPALHGTAQDRYVDEIFDEVSMSDGVVYGENYSVEPLLTGGTEAELQDLLMDVYQPVGDDATDRPLVLLFHTGNFVPFPINGSTGGTRKDSAIVEMANQLARRGFVTASVDYRLGWNPFDMDQEVRVYGLINAVYRTIQDARTCIRYFKKDAVDNGNTYGIDTSKIVLWGLGSGAYLVNATATIDNYPEIVLPKFISGGLPMVVEAINGNIFGTSLGIVPPGYPILSEGDTLCVSNWSNFDSGDPISSDYAMTVNMGGALGDTSWIDEKVVPWISFQNPTDPDAPFVEGLVNVPGLNLPVVEVQGAYLIQQLQKQFGNNDVWEDVEFVDPVSAAAAEANAKPVTIGNETFPGLTDVEGLYALVGDNSAPWDWWSPDNPNAPDDEDPDKGRALMYIDTILQFAIPRACIALDLGCNLDGVVSTEDIIPSAQVDLNIFPNPSSGSIFFQAEGESPIRGIQLFDLNGRLVHNVEGLRDPQYVLRRGTLPAGTYIAQIRFEEGVVAQRLVLK